MYEKELTISYKENWIRSYVRDAVVDVAPELPDVPLTWVPDPQEGRPVEEVGGVTVGHFVDVRTILEPGDVFGSDRRSVDLAEELRLGAALVDYTRRRRPLNLSWVWCCKKNVSFEIWLRKYVCKANGTRLKQISC